MSIFLFDFLRSLCLFSKPVTISSYASSPVYYIEPSVNNNYRMTYFCYIAVVLITYKNMDGLPAVAIVIRHQKVILRRKEGKFARY